MAQGHVNFAEGSVQSVKVDPSRIPKGPVSGLDHHWALTRKHGLHEHLCWSRQMPSLFLLTKTRITRTGAENHVTNLLITRTTFSEFGIKIASN